MVTWSSSATVNHYSTQRRVGSGRTAKDASGHPAGSYLVWMQQESAPGRGDPRWEYRILWRYGPLGLVLIGVSLLAIGASGLCATTVSVTLLPIGLVCLLAGVVLPRIEGVFTAGPQGISAPLLAVHKLDTYTVTGTAVTADQAAALASGRPAGIVLLGDVWDALEERLGVADGFRDLGAATGTRYVEAPDGRTLQLTNRGFLDWRPASGDLLELLASWGVKPIASGKYPVPSYAAPDKATGPVSGRLVSREGSTDSA